MLVVDPRETRACSSSTWNAILDFVKGAGSRESAGPEISAGLLTVH